jgi:hypothetical protein
VDAAIGQALVSVDAASSVLNDSSGSSLSSKDRANAYDDILITSQDTVDATKQAIEELEKEGVAEGDARMQDLRVTSLAVNYDLISWRIGRNRVLTMALRSHQILLKSHDDRAKMERNGPSGKSRPVESSRGFGSASPCTMRYYRVLTRSRILGVPSATQILLPSLTASALISSHSSA